MGMAEGLKFCCALFFYQTSALGSRVEACFVLYVHVSLQI